MKKLLLVAILFWTGKCYSQPAQPTAAEFKKLSWLEGTWTRTNVKPGRGGSERWVKNSETEWQGWGTNLNGRDTTFVEKLQLITKDGNIYYVADVPGNKEKVYFIFTSLTENSFVCENPQHDFPKKIAYQKDGPVLRATISGDGKSIEYVFEKK